MGTGQWAVGTVAVLLAAGPAVVGVTAATGCTTGGRADVVAGDRVDDDLAAGRTAVADEAAQLRSLARAGLPATARWGLWNELPGPDDTRTPQVTGALVLGDTVVTVQTGERDARLLAGYAAADGAPRWSAGLPPSSSPVELTGSGGLVVARHDREVAALDPLTGDVRWCTGVRDGARVTVHPTAPGLLVAEQDGGDSRLRLFDPATGTPRWTVAYEAHDAMTAPVVAGDTVTVLAVGAQRSGAEAFRLDTGRSRWSSTVDFPRPLGAAGGVLLVRSDAGLQGLDPGSGRTVWTSAELGAEIGSGTTVLTDAGPAVATDAGPAVPAVLLDAAGGAQSGSGLVGFDPADGTVRWRLAGADLESDGRWYGVRRAYPIGDRVLLQDVERTVVVERGTGRVVGRSEPGSLLAVTDRLAVLGDGLRTTVVARP